MEKTMTWEEFLEDITQLEAASKKLCDGWERQEWGGEPAQTYLRKRVRLRDSTGAASDACADLEDELLEQEDGAEAAKPEDRVTLEYHLTYSLSYQVPVMFFNAWRPSGEFLGAEEVWALASAEHQGAVEEAKWGAVSQQDHPLLGTPFYFFHPCNTAKVLADLDSGAGGANKVLAWLSVVGPLVGLKVPLDYVKIFSNKEAKI